MNIRLPIIILTIIFYPIISIAMENQKIINMIVGNYNQLDEPGLYSFSFNQENGEAIELDSLEIRNPSYFTFNKTGDTIFAVSELNEDNSTINAISFDKCSGRLALLNSELVYGSPCYVTTNGHILVTANYGGGSISLFEVLSNPNNFVSKIISQYQGSLGGTDAVRQNKPHIHCVEFSPDGKRLYATDFSSDQILYYNVEDSIHPAMEFDMKQKSVILPPETGPRHLIFDKSGRYAYLIGELSGNIFVFDIDHNDLKIKQIIEADVAHGRGSADIHLSPDGKFLYASNRLKNDGLAIFSVDPENGNLEYAGYQKTGSHPRNFAISPNGKYVLVACRDKNAIEFYERDMTTGLLRPLNKTINIDKPVCIKFSENSICD